MSDERAMEDVGVVVLRLVDALEGQDAVDALAVALGVLCARRRAAVQAALAVVAVSYAATLAAAEREKS